MNEEPLITVNILSHNRKNELHRTLVKVYELGFKNIELIVVDTSFTNGTPKQNS